MDLTRSDMEIETLVRRIKAGELDTQPDFQRGEVWDRKRQRRLIDTILREWHVPPLHIVSDSLSGAESLMDGQQRMRAIVGFLEDEFAVDGQIPPSNKDIEKLDGKKFSQLDEATQRRFRRFSITVISLKNFEPEEPSELFFRLNQQYTLTPPEKRNALFGPARDQVRDLVRTFMESGLFSRETLGFSNDRLAYDDVVARACMVLERRSLDLTIKGADIEHFYRNGKFSERTLDLLLAAADWLSLAFSTDNRQESTVARIRLNKATLFSWIVFAARAAIDGNQRMLAPEFLVLTEIARKQVSETPTAWQSRALEIFSSRSSYRVADASSQVLRDVILALLYADRYEALPHQMNLVLRLDGRIEQSRDLEHFFLMSAEELGWSQL